MHAVYLRTARAASYLPSATSTSAGLKHLQAQQLQQQPLEQVHCQSPMQKFVVSLGHGCMHGV